MPTPSEINTARSQLISAYQPKASQTEALILSLLSLIADRAGTGGGGGGSGDATYAEQVIQSGLLQDIIERLPLNGDGTRILVEATGGTGGGGDASEATLQQIRDRIGTTDAAVVGSVIARLATLVMGVSNLLTDTQLRATPISVNVASGVTTDGLTDTQLRAQAVAITASALPLPVGAATETTLATLFAKLESIETKLTSTETKIDSLVSAIAVPTSAVIVVIAATPNVVELVDDPTVKVVQFRNNSLYQLFYSEGGDGTKNKFTDSIPAGATVWIEGNSRIEGWFEDAPESGATGNLMVTKKY